MADGKQPWQDVAREVLPSWFVDRITAETGRFALLLDTRQVLIIDAIHAVRRGSSGMVWMDVELVVPFRKDGFPWGHFPVIKSTGPDRARCSVNAAQIVAVVEVDPWDLPPLDMTSDDAGKG